MEIKASEDLAKHLGMTQEELDSHIDELNEQIKEDAKKNAPQDESKLKLKVEF